MKRKERLGVPEGCAPWWTFVCTVPVLAIVACGPRSANPRGDGGLASSEASVADGAPSADAPGADAGGSSDAAPSFMSAAHRPFPALKAHSGQVLKPLTLVTVTAQNDALAGQLESFGDALAGSAWWQTVGAPYGLASMVSSVHVRGPSIAAGMIDQASMIAYLQTEIAEGAAPPPNGQTCYLLYLPDGVSVGGNGTPPFGSYHAPFPAPNEGMGDGWAVVSRGTPYGGGETQLQELTRVASHEILEAATDPTWNSYSLAAPSSPPWMGAIWDVFQVPGPIECGDLCEGTRIVEGLADGGFEYQRIWSDQAAGTGGDPCAPGLGEPYFNTSVPKDWYPMVGSSVSIPVTGWSSAQTNDWHVIATVGQSTGGFSSLAGAILEVASPLGKDQDGGNQACYGVGMNNGVVATVKANAPSQMASGDYAVIQIESFRLDTSSCDPPLGGDQFHFWLVGIYAP